MDVSMREGHGSRGMDPPLLYGSGRCPVNCSVDMPLICEDSPKLGYCTGNRVIASTVSSIWVSRSAAELFIEIVKFPA